MPNIVDLDNNYGAVLLGDVTVRRVLTIGRQKAGSPTIAPLLFAGISTASGAVMGFAKGSFISVASILGIGGAGGSWDYIIPVEVNGVQRGIPLTSIISLGTPATF